MTGPLFTRDPSVLPKAAERIAMLIAAVAVLFVVLTR